MKISVESKNKNFLSTSVLDFSPYNHMLSVVLGFVIMGLSDGHKSDFLQGSGLKELCCSNVFYSRVMLFVTR